MREIKFRAWVSSESQMYYTGFYIHQLTGKCFYEYDGDFKCDYKDQLTPPMYDCGEEEPILMQYTGLKDKNGKEIYEGDILESKRADYKKIAAYHEARGMWIGQDGFNEPLYYDILYWEVIGNLYENPELL